MRNRRRNLVWKVAGLVLAGTAAAPARGAPADASPASPVIVVEAGALDRKQTPVVFPVPAGLAGAGPLALQDPQGRTLQLQINDGQGHFVLPALGRGKQARFRIVPAAASNDAPNARDTKAGRVQGVDVQREDDKLVVRVAGAPVFHFRTRAPAPTAEVPARYTRAGYLHPVFTPGGEVVTDDSPADHGHHHGIWTAWTVAEFAGRRMSFWGPEPGRLKNDLVSVVTTFGGPVAGGFTARLASTDLGVQPPRQVLDSQWRVVVHHTAGARAGRPAFFLFDSEWTDQVVGKEPLVLPEYRYGGLGVRGNRAWIDATRATFLTSEGDDRLAGENTRARWVHLGGTLPTGGRRAGLAVLVHPMNLRAPEPVRLNPGIPLLCVSPVKAGPLKIEAGHPYSARYRFVVSDGPADPALLERLWRDYARAPIVKVQAAASAGLRLD